MNRGAFLGGILDKIIPRIEFERCINFYLDQDTDVLVEIDEDTRFGYTHLELSIVEVARDSLRGFFIYSNIMEYLGDKIHQEIEKINIKNESAYTEATEAWRNSKWY